MVTVRSLIQLLHGCPVQTFWFSQLEELRLLLETLQIRLTSEKTASLLASSHQTSSEVVITKLVQSNKRRKTYGQIRQYRDWSKVGPDSLAIKEEPMETEDGAEAVPKENGENSGEGEEKADAETAGTILD